MSLHSHQRPANSSVVKFANIIAILHNSESSQSLNPSSLSHLSTQIRTTMASSLHDLVPLFYEQDANHKGKQQDPAKFIETLTFAIDEQVYANEIRR